MKEVPQFKVGDKVKYHSDNCQEIYVVIRVQPDDKYRLESYDSIVDYARAELLEKVEDAQG